MVFDELYKLLREQELVFKSWDDWASSVRSNTNNRTGVLDMLVNEILSNEDIFHMFGVLNVDDREGTIPVRDDVLIGNDGLRMRVTSYDDVRPKTNYVNGRYKKRPIYISGPPQPRFSSAGYGEDDNRQAFAFMQKPYDNYFLVVRDESTGKVDIYCSPRGKDSSGMPIMRTNAPSIFLGESSFERVAWYDTDRLELSKLVAHSPTLRQDTSLFTQFYEGLKLTIEDAIGKSRRIGWLYSQAQLGNEAQQDQLGGQIAALKALLSPPGTPQLQEGGRYLPEGGQ